MNANRMMNETQLTQPQLGDHGLDNWRELPIRQQPSWPDRAQADMVQIGRAHV